MAVINQTFPSLLDVAKRTDPSGRIAKIAEVLTIDSPIIADCPWVEANGPDGHLVTTRTGLPSGTWRRFNQGVTPTKSNTAQFTETCGMLDAYSNVDVALAKRNGNEAEFRQSEDLAFVAGLKRQMETAFVYASTKTTPEQIAGLSPRLDVTSGNSYSNQIIKHDAGASGSDQTSIWLIGWAPRKVYGIYPKGSTAGLDQQDLGVEMVDDGVTAGAKFRAYRSYFTWNAGLCVEDYRYLIRICNIDTSNLAATGSALIQSMMEATERIQSLEDCSPVFYMNRTVRSFLRKQEVDTVKNSTLEFDRVGGKPVMSFSGIPIHRTDAILNTEAIIS